MASKVGKLIREARTTAGLTQEALAKKLGKTVSASDVSKAERGELDFPQTVLRNIAKICGVTQTSLIEAAKGGSGKSSTKAATTKTAAKTGTKASTKTSTKTATKTAAKTKTPANANSTMKVTATERKLVEAYRLADSEAKKRALSILKGEDMMEQVLSGGSDAVADFIEDMAGKLFGGR